MKEFDIIRYCQNDYEVPKKCPQCGSIAFTEYVTSTSIRSAEGIYHFVVFKKNCCEKNFICIYLEINPPSCPTTYEYISSIPEYVSIEDVPKCIEIIAPRFLAIYKQSVTALSHGLDEVATSGFRNSLEFLIKEYAINFLEDPKNEVSKLTLYESINRYFPDLKAENTGHFIRIIGNDATHFEQKYESVDANIIKWYIELILKPISTKYNLKHPPELKRLSQTDYEK